jgi:hypothetical protein
LYNKSIKVLLFFYEKSNDSLGEITRFFLFLGLSIQYLGSSNQHYES